MANTFKNSVTAGVSTATACYTCPAATTATVIGCTVSNIDTSAVASVDVQVVDVSPDPDVTAHIVKGAPVPVNGSLVAIGGDQKVVLEAGDQISVTSTTANSDVIVSVLEIT